MHTLLEINHIAESELASLFARYFGLGYVVAIFVTQTLEYASV